MYLSIILRQSIKYLLIFYRKCPQKFLQAGTNIKCHLSVYPLTDLVYYEWQCFRSLSVGKYLKSKMLSFTYFQNHPVSWTGVSRAYSGPRALYLTPLTWLLLFLLQSMKLLPNLDPKLRSIVVQVTVTYPHLLQWLGQHVATLLLVDKDDNRRLEAVRQNLQQLLPAKGTLYKTFRILMQVKFLVFKINACIRLTSSLPLT